MPPFSASMRRPPFKPWIVWTRFCRFRQGVPNATALNTTGMEPCSVCGTEYRNRSRPWQNGRSLHQPRIRRLSQRSRISVSAPAADSHHPRQPRGSQNPVSPGFPRAEPASPVSLHAHLFVLAQPSGTLVRQDRTGCHCSRYLHFCARPGTQASPLYQCLFSPGTSDSLEVL